MSVWNSSFELMLMGMGTVFFFLVLLIGITKCMSFIVNGLFEFGSDAKVGGVTVSNDVEQEVAAVAAIAYAHSKLKN